MAKMQQDDERVSHGVNLLISILVRYPEIGTVNFDPDDNTIKLTFMLSSPPAPKDFARIKTLLLSSISAYHMLEGTRAISADFQLSTCDQVAMLTVLRDVATMSKGEITLIICLLREQMQELLICDENDAIPEEDLLVQEEVIVDMLENVKAQHSGNGLIGIREDGKVLVFNK